MKYRRPRRRGGTAGPFTGIFIVSLFRTGVTALRRETEQYFVSPSAFATPLSGLFAPVTVPAFSRFILSSATRKIASCYEASLKRFIKERERDWKNDCFSSYRNKRAGKTRRRSGTEREEELGAAEVQQEATGKLLGTR